MSSIVLGGRTVRAGGSPYVIAEIGVNHGGSLETAFRLIDLAREGGADAAKFQTYKAGKLASKHSPAYWDTTKEATTSQFQLFKKYDTFGPDEYRALAAHCRKTGIEFCSTPFDEEAVDLLDGLMSYFKIASADVTNVPLLRAVASKKKPVVLSTGASTLAEVDLALDELTRAGCESISLMHCVLNYPTDRASANLRMIESLARAFPGKVLGYSDHTVADESMSALTSAYLLGATVLEKHFTHDKSLPGNDHYHAMDVDDLRRAKAKLADVEELLGSSTCKRPLESEARARAHARRSVVVKHDLKAGQALTPADLTCKRPGSGISPLHWDELIGRRVARDVAEDAVLAWSDLESV